MKPFVTFYVTGYEFDPKTLKASFFYSFDHEVDFVETIDFACPGFTPIDHIDPPIINNLLFHLSLALGISYYKLYPTKDIVVEHGNLSPDQQQFRYTFYTQGLGEFFFKNGLSFTGLLNFVSTGPTTAPALFSASSGTPLVAFGGGKDSLVSIELIKQLGLSFSTVSFGKDYYLHQRIGLQIGVPRLVILRTLDPQLFDMNHQGYYNGHVPISGIIAFVLATASYLYNYTYIVMSNEKSANEGNTIMDGLSINHQRSKSEQFESAFGQYIAQYISPDLKYFSLLRGMYEIKIAQLFSHYFDYFNTFSSCNNNFKLIEEHKTTDLRRCGICPKCAFVYSILRPFLADEEMMSIFGQDLYANEQLLPLYEQLLGIDGIKPFECVGTNEEVTYAMYLHYLYIKDTGPFPPIIAMFVQKVLPHLSEEQLHHMEQKLFTITPSPFIPPLFQEVLQG